ncbi:hypothetical protein UFVDC4_00231 [Staphylococcus phage vB_SauM-UFV_DC4]|nr:hypothetical protein UFVDC4_00231 [Staphylococcus phage vB_SauM-UFV_DC4]BDE75809.1 hypothetical protein [Staphylococcus phage S6]
MEELNQAIELFNNDLERINEDVSNVLMKEMKEESNRKELEILEDKLGSTGDSKTFRDFYSMKMIRRKSDDITGLSYSDFVKFFTDENELNSEENFARNIMDFLSMSRSVGFDEFLPEGQSNISERVFALMLNYTDENMGTNLNFQEIYNIILVTYIDLFVYYNRADLIKGNDITKKEDNKVIKSFSDSVINEFLNESIKAMQASEVIKLNSGKIPKNINPMEMMSLEQVGKLKAEEAEGTSKELNANMLLVKTILEYRTNVK